jgi:hypothetical protein
MPSDKGMMLKTILLILFAVFVIATILLVAKEVLSGYEIKFKWWKIW